MKQKKKKKNRNRKTRQQRTFQYRNVPSTTHLFTATTITKIHSTNFTEDQQQQKSHP